MKMKIKAKTVVLNGTEVKVEVFGSYKSVRNDGKTTVYISADPGIIPDGDGVLSLARGEAVTFPDAHGEFYLKGTGKVLVMGTGSEICPFNNPAGDGGLLAGEISAAALNYNPDFRINQRGSVEYTTDGSIIYTVDRWRAQNYYKISVSDNGVRISPTQAVVSNNTALLQDIELPMSANVNAVTLSFNGSGVKAYIRLSALDSSGAIISATKTLAINGEDNFVSLENIPLDAVKLRISVNFSAGAGTEDYCELSWVKLETGILATEFSTPDPAIELARCQRYYQIRTIGDIPAEDLRPVMRANPTIRQRGDGTYEYDAEL